MQRFQLHLPPGSDSRFGTSGAACLLVGALASPLCLGLPRFLLVLGVAIAASRLLPQPCGSTDELIAVVEFELQHHKERQCFREKGTILNKKACISLRSYLHSRFLGRHGQRHQLRNRLGSLARIFPVTLRDWLL